MIPDILASRYSSTKISAIWSPKGKVRLEREFWIAVMKAQRNLGVDIQQSAIEAYEEVLEQIDLESIAGRERKLRHDVKSRIEEFCELAGHEQIHKGMTSRDLTDNVEQLQILRSLRLLRSKTVAVLHQLSLWSLGSKEIMLVARTHNVPAQPTTLGKRLAMFGEEIMFALKRLDHLIENEPSMATPLPRQTGQKEGRYAHLLSGEPDISAMLAATASTGASTGLAARVTELETELENMRSRLSAIEEKLN